MNKLRKRTQQTEGVTRKSIERRHKKLTGRVIKEEKEAAKTRRATKKTVMIVADAGPLFIAKE